MDVYTDVLSTVKVVKSSWLLRDNITPVYFIISASYSAEKDNKTRHTTKPCTSKPSDNCEFIKKKF